MRNLRSLQRSTPTKRPPFKGPKLVVPRACMSIQEMLQRFVRREALPMEKPGIYVDAGYDLEKVAGMDRVDQQDVLNEVRDDVDRKKSALDSEVARQELAKAKASPAPAKKKVKVQKDPKSSVAKQP